MHTESPKIVKLKKELIKKLPFFPDDKTTLQYLEQQSMVSVLFYYLHWATRQIPIRNRKIHRYPELTNDLRYKQLKDDINYLLKEVECGADLSPYLSIKAHKKGYTPTYRITNGDVDSWEDKDQILNTKGFHHFHLSKQIQNSGLSVRTNEVLFAKVTRTEFHAYAIFDHSVFDNTNPNGVMNPERSRMWQLHEKCSSLGVQPGSVYISHPITMSGHPLYLNQLAAFYMHKIDHLTPKLEDRAFVNEIYSSTHQPIPNKYKLNWVIEGLDLIIFDSKNSINFIIHEGDL